MKKGDEKYEDIVFYMNIYGDLLGLFDIKEEGREVTNMLMNLEG